MALSSDQVKTLDRLRTQLSQLTNSVSKLRHELETKDPLPTWATLSTSANALSFNLGLLTDTLSSHAQFLKEAHAYPLPNFPGPSQEVPLNQLLRKKLEPGVEDWIYEHTTKQQIAAQVNGAGQHDERLQNQELRELWSWASRTSSSIVVPMLEDGGALNDDYTIAEREDGIENVVTGLRNLDRDSEDEDEDEDEDEGEGMEGIQPSAGVSAKEEDGTDPSQPPMPLESVLRFMTTGTLPSGRPPVR